VGLDGSNCEALAKAQRNDGQIAEMENAVPWLLAVATGTLAVAMCGLLVTLILAHRLRRALRHHHMMLTNIAQLGHLSGPLIGRLTELKNLNVHVSARLCDIHEELQELTRTLNNSGNSLGFDVSGNEHGLASDTVVDLKDTYEQLDQNWGSIHDPTGRQERSCAIDGDRSRTAVIVILGQSNAANHGAGKYVARRRVDNFSLYDRKCYSAVDPLLGASGHGGNFAVRLGDKLIDAGLFERVILAPIAMGGTTVEQWAEEGMFNRRIPALIRRLYDAGLRADFILWQQGEGNPGVGDVGGRQYRKNLLEVIRTFRRYGARAPFFVSLTTMCGGPHANADNIRAGQKSVVNPMAAIYQGPDTDTIGLEHRWDDCHFDEIGLDMAASLWLDVIAGYCHSSRHADVGSSGIELVAAGQQR
jgi:Carbohydrate esterase, sialic acid-specific acetylesterase